MRFYVRALSYFRADAKWIGLLLTLIGISTFTGLLMAWPMAILVDSVIGSGARDDLFHRAFFAILPTTKPGQIVGLALVGLALKFLQDGLGIAQKVVTNVINYNGLMRVRCDLYKKLQALNLSYHKEQPLGDAIYRLSSDTYGCQNILAVIISTVVATVTLLVMSAILISRSLPLTLLALSITPLLAITNIVFGRRLKARSLECKQVDTEFTSLIHRTLGTIGLVQAFCREQAEFSRFRGSVSKNIAAWWRLNRQEILYTLIIGIVFGAGGAAIFGYGGYLVYRDQFLTHNPAGLTLGDLMVFTAYLGMLWGPLCTLTGLSANMQGGAAGCQRVFEVLDRHVTITDAPDALSLPIKPRTLELQQIGFEYQPGKPVLRDVDVEINPGEMVAFVGSSGVGKSTLLNLLPRFYDPTKGAMKLDGIDARRIKIADLRQHVALVLQDSVILPTTIAENIAYGRPEATLEDVREAAHLAGADEFIEDMPQGYETPISEGGQNLSGGQRQRIAIARALLTQAPFIVLDEPTSALDPHHEQVITHALKAIKGQRTILLVSHRLSTVVDADQIFVMEQGRIVERGTHDELMALRGPYYNMARIQFKIKEAREWQLVA
jgi:ABC-type multidrug transport system fused ATPase/permease subunit